ncbi:hypothetical protein GCM10022224_066710 [Nonomuraea antimicrobica]|uniref:Uncharacterized protein n=1 Tax=Nonomuraea antimicrobica TaxID=561173 RepID=A0ABP7CN73_9ACTN
MPTRCSPPWAATCPATREALDRRPAGARPGDPTLTATTIAKELILTIADFQDTDRAFYALSEKAVEGRR